MAFDFKKEYKEFYMPIDKLEIISGIFLTKDVKGTCQK